MVIVTFSIGFLSGFLACGIAAAVYFRDAVRALRILENHRRYMRAEYRIDEYLEELTSERSADL